MKKGQQEIETWLRTLVSPNAELDFLTTYIGDRRVLILKVGCAVNQPVTFQKTAYVRIGSYTKRLQDFPSRQAALWGLLRSGTFENDIAKDDLVTQDIIALLDTQSCFDNLKRPYPSTSQLVVDYFVEEGIVQQQDNGMYAITNMGALLFAKNLSGFGGLGRKKARIIRYEGDNKLGNSKESIYTAGYATNFDAILNVIDAMTPSTETITGGLRSAENAYPEIALREAVANALIHQDLSVTGAGPMIEIFDHRMEITNPGGLMVDKMRIIDAPPRSRNEKLAALMRRMKICEERGSGWDKIGLSCEMQELPAPGIQDYGTSTKITLYTERPFSRLTSTEREWSCYIHACLRYVNEDSNSTYMTNSTLRRRFGEDQASAATISKLIKKTVDAGLIRPLEKDTSPRYMKYVPSWA